MVDTTKWGTKLEKSYQALIIENERRQEMLDIMSDVADGHEKSEAKNRLETITKSFMGGNLSADLFRDAYIDYYNTYIDDDDSDHAFL